jgi:hypothetical protein
MATETIRETVRNRYGQAALEVAKGAKSSCCDSTCCGGSKNSDPITSDLYAKDETDRLP